MSKRQQVQQAADAAVELVVGSDKDSVESEQDSEDEIVRVEKLIRLADHDAVVIKDGKESHLFNSRML